MSSTNPPTSFWPKAESQPALELPNTHVLPVPDSIVEAQTRRLQQRQDPLFLAYMETLSPGMRKLADDNIGGFAQNGSPILTIEDLDKKIKYVAETLQSRGISIDPDAQLNLAEVKPRANLQAGNAERARLAWRKAVQERAEYLAVKNEEIRELHDAYYRARGK